MKKFILILIFILFISATPDTENLNITVERKDDLTILVSWNVLFEAVSYTHLTLPTIGCV